jgi:hypothetical protein
MRFGGMLLGKEEGYLRLSGKEEEDSSRIFEGRNLDGSEVLGLFENGSRLSRSLRTS